MVLSQVLVYYTYYTVPLRSPVLHWDVTGAAGGHGLPFYS